MNFNKILDPIEQRITTASGITESGKNKLMVLLNSLEEIITKLNTVTEKLSEEQIASLSDKTDYHKYLEKVKSLKMQLRALSMRTSSTKSKSMGGKGKSKKKSRRNRRTKKNKSFFSFFM
uniref:Uncharacterized protein n=1 Tax=viral metagenome TaxID=1070528 RepID=A0A6C0BAG0_9ZZZZ